MKLSTWTVRLTLLVMSVGITSATARALGAGWARSYRAPADAPAWSGGTLAPAANGTGYLLAAQGPGPTNQPLSSSQTLAHLDAYGFPDWGVWAVEGQTGYTTLKASPPDRVVYASIEGLSREENWLVFGLFSVSDGGRLFERGVALHPDQSPPRADYLSDGRSVVILDYAEQRRVELAVLDAAGEVQWQRSFAAPSFTLLGYGPRSTLIEYPGQGFWLVVAGSEVISREPNPPVYNYRHTLNIVRLNSEGEVLWSSQIQGLITSQVLPALGPAAIGANGTLVLSFTDTIRTSPLNPAAGGFASSVLLLNPGGQLRWAGQVHGVAGTGVTPFWTPDQSAVFVAGPKMRSLNPLRVDGLILKLSAATGDLLAQTAVADSDLDLLTIAGVTESRVYLHNLAGRLGAPTQPSPLKSFIGYVDFNLQDPQWKVFKSTNGLQAAALFLNRPNPGLTYSCFPTGGSQLEVIQLNQDLNLLLPTDSACPLFTQAVVPLRDPQMTIRELSLSESPLNLMVTNAAVVLPPTTRIQLQWMTPQSRALCENPSPAPAQPGGTLDLNFESDLVQGLNGSTIRQIALQRDGKILLGGYTLFSRSNALQQGVVRLHPDGTFDHTFKPNLTSSQVQSVLVLASGKILVGGAFKPAGLPAPHSIVRLNSDGSLDETFLVGPGADFVVMCLLEQPDGKILVGGLFSSMAGVLRKGVARLHSDGSLDTTFPGLPWYISHVSQMALQSDGKILLWSTAGFAKTPTQSLGQVVRLHPDGSVDATFAWQRHWEDYTTFVSCVALQPDDKILVGFHNARLGTNEFTGLVRLNPDASLDTSFTPVRQPTRGRGSLFNYPDINAIVIQSDGKLLVGGGFTQINGTRHAGVVRLNPDGSLDSSFDTGQGPGGLIPHVTALQLQPDGKLLVGGPFTRFSGASGGLVRLYAEPRIHLELLNVANDAVTVVLSSTVAEPVRVETSLDLVTWTPLLDLTNAHNAVTLNNLTNHCFYRALAGRSRPDD